MTPCGISDKLKVDTPSNILEVDSDQRLAGIPSFSRTFCCCDFYTVMAQFAPDSCLSVICVWSGL